MLLPWLFESWTQTHQGVARNPAQDASSEPASRMFVQLPNASPLAESLSALVCVSRLPQQIQDRWPCPSMTCAHRPRLQKNVLLMATCDTLHPGSFAPCTICHVGRVILTSRRRPFELLHAVFYQRSSLYQSLPTHVGPSLTGCPGLQEKGRAFSGDAGRAWAATIGIVAKGNASSVVETTSRQFATPEFLREHPPRTSRTYEIAQRIDDLTQVCFAPPTFSRSRGQERTYKRPFFVRQIAGVPFDSLREFLLPRTVFFCPHAFL